MPTIMPATSQQASNASLAIGKLGLEEAFCLEKAEGNERKTYSKATHKCLWSEMRGQRGPATHMLER